MIMMFLLTPGGVWLRIGNMRTFDMARIVAKSLIAYEILKGTIVRIDFMNEDTYKVVSEFYGLDE